MSYRRSGKRIHDVFALLWALALTPVLHAQQGVSVLPEPLRSMPRAGESCKNEQTAAAAQNDARTLGGLAALSCIASSADAREPLEPQIMIIDVRQESQFQRYHIPGSANLPARSLAHKPSLKHREILLVGDGRSGRELYSVCGLLKQSGFSSVRVLAGGMVSYLAGGLPVNGHAPRPDELARIDAAQLWAEGQFAENLIVIADKSAAYSDHLPYALAITEATPVALTAVLGRHRKDVRRPVATVVLVAGQVLTETRYKELAASIAPIPLLFYADSPSALKAFISSQKAVWAAHARGPKQPRCG